jgi:hypothetical protein
MSRPTIHCGDLKDQVTLIHTLGCCYVRSRDTRSGKHRLLLRLKPHSQHQLPSHPTHLKRDLFSYFSQSPYTLDIMRASAWALPFIRLAAALPAITRSGKYLYDPTGARFYIKVLVYCKDVMHNADQRSGRSLSTTRSIGDGERRQYRKVSGSSTLQYAH